MSAPNEKHSANEGGKEIPHPRRILAVSLTESVDQLSAVIKELTGIYPIPQPPTTSSPSPSPPSLAGTTHHLPLSTPYYTATIPIWLDLISSPSDWSSSFLSEEAKEVLDVLGGVIVVVDLHSTQPSPTKQQHQDLVRHIGKVVREGLGGWDWDGVSLAVGVGKQAVEDEELDEWEDVCAEGGLEFVHFVQSGSQEKEREQRNEYGERTGVERVLEALEANDWSGGGAPGEHELDFDNDDNKEEEEDDQNFEFSPKGLGFGFDKEDFEGLKKAIWEQIGEETEAGEGSEKKRGKDEEEEEEEEEEGLDDDDIKNLEQMMLKLQAVRDMSAGLPEQQRKRMAKQAVEEVMRDL